MRARRLLGSIDFGVERVDARQTFNDTGNEESAGNNGKTDKTLKNLALSGSDFFGIAVGGHIKVPSLEELNNHVEAAGDGGELENVT